MSLWPLASLVVIETLCNNCRKPKLAGRAGSITSYFFQHNYCRCDIASKTANSTAKSKASKVNSTTKAEVSYNTCSNCGKVKAENKRAGSFSAFLFRELRCTCGGVTFVKASEKSQAKTPAQSVARQTAERKRFTANQRKTNFQKSSGSSLLLPSETLVSGTFRIISVIGYGGMGAVYLVQHAGLQRNFVLKVLLPNLVNEKNWQRFKAEARTVAALNHPTIVKVYDLGIHENSLPFYSMDYVAGKTLEDHLIEDGALSLGEMVQVFSQVLDGLAYAHRNGIVHRDIKPANIMLGNSENFDGVKILDFGIAKLLDSDPDKQGLTVAGEVFGSPYYMSPEQTISSQVDARSDIYSVGCTLFEALTLNVPFDADNSLDILELHRSAKPPRLNQFRADFPFPDSLECVMAKCLAKAPNDRYQMVKELALDLSRIADGKDLSSYPHLVKQYADLKRERSIASGADCDDDREIEDGDGETKTSDRTAEVLVVSLALVLLLTAALGSYIYFLSSKKGSEPVVHRERLEENMYRPASDEAGLGSGSIGSAAPDSAKALRSGAGAIDKETRLKIEKYLKERKAPYAAQLPGAKKGKKYFDFPSDFSIGKMQISDHGRVSQVIDARGRMAISADAEIKLWTNQNSEIFPELLELFRADDLHALDVTSTRSKSQLIKCLQHLTGLVRLDLQFCDLRSDDLPAFEKLTKLQSLNLGNSSVSGSLFALSPVLPRLEELTVNNVDNYVPILKALLKAGKIRFLSLSGKIKLEESMLVGQLPKLRSLHLTNLILTTLDCENLSRSESIKNLDLYSIRISVEKLKALSKLRHLESLSFEESEGSPKDIILALESFKQLKSVSLPTYDDRERAFARLSLPNVIIKE